MGLEEFIEPYALTVRFAMIDPLATTTAFRYTETAGNSGWVPGSSPEKIADSLQYTGNIIG
jgi:hypothetical protein